MAAQNGKDLLIKLDMTGDGQFETIAGLRATRIFVQRGKRGCDQPGKPGWLARAAGRRGREVGVDFRLGRVQGRDHG